jgi:PRC-barrel domain protein
MSADTMGIDKGMAVYTLDGGELGTVRHIWVDDGEIPASPQDYLEAGEGRFLGIGEHDLYIPFDAVVSVVPGASVTVNCSREECVALYAAKPDFIEKQEDELRKKVAAITAATNPVIFH